MKGQIKFIPNPKLVVSNFKTNSMAILDVDSRADEDARLRTEDGRNKSLDTSRQTVNTHNSILDLSREEDDDEEAKSVLFESLTVVSMDSDDDSKTSGSTQGSKKFSLDSFLGGSFMDGLCTPDFVPGTPCVVPPGCAQRINCTRPRILGKRQSRRSQCDDRVMLSTDILDLLGCVVDPGTFEKDEIWSRKLDLSRPNRANLKNRMRRIRELRNSAHRSQTSSRHGFTLSHSRKSRYGYRSILERARTTDEHDPLSQYIGKGMDPIVPDYNGYDSDPEVHSNQHSPSSRQSVPVDRFEVKPSMDEDTYIQDIIQVCVNCASYLKFLASLC